MLLGSLFRKGSGAGSSEGVSFGDAANAGPSAKRSRAPADIARGQPSELFSQHREALARLQLRYGKAQPKAILTKLIVDDVALDEARSRRQSVTLRARSW